MTEAAFVTGGSGFIGGRLVERLVSEGRAVRALARSEASAQRVAELGAEPVRGEIGDRESLAVATQGADVAFHLAAQLGAHPGVHDRHLQGPCQAGLRPGRHPRAGAGGASGSGLSHELALIRAIGG